MKKLVALASFVLVMIPVVVLVHLWSKYPDVVAERGEIQARFIEYHESIRAEGTDVLPTLAQIVDDHPRYFASGGGDYPEELRAIQQLRYSGLADDQHAVAYSYLEEAEEFLRRVDSMLEEHTAAYSPVATDPVSNSVFGVLLEYLGTLRRINVVLLSRYAVSALNGDWVRVETIAAQQRQILSYCLDSPRLINSLVGVSMISAYCDDVRALAIELDLPREARKTIGRELELSLGLLVGVLPRVYETEMLVFEDGLFSAIEMVEQQDGVIVAMYGARDIDDVIRQTRENAGTYWEAPRLRKTIEPVDGGIVLSKAANIILSTLPRAREALDMAVHEVAATLAVLELEDIRQDTGEYPSELPAYLIERIPEKIRFGVGIVYVPADDRQSYELLMPPEVPLSHSEYRGGVYTMERAVLDEDEGAFLDGLVAKSGGAHSVDPD